MLAKLIPTGLIAIAAWANIVADVRALIDHNNFTLADAMLQKYRTEHGVTPEMLEALSWLGRGSLAAKQLDKAQAYAVETQRLAVEQLKNRPLDAESHLPLALGAAIEVQGQVLNAQGDRSGAVAFLRKELAAYRATSIRTRIQKNINLLSLEGKAAPVLDQREYLGAKPQPFTSLKEEGPILAQIEKEYAVKRLVVVAPTQRYGYVARGEEAGPAEELKYIDEVRHKFYADLLNVPAPISDENFKNYGASTTPTLVLIDRQGIVRMYHPGRMTLEEIRAALNKLG